jgi:hypothetical protein
MLLIYTKRNDRTLGQTVLSASSSTWGTRKHLAGFLKSKKKKTDKAKY